MSPVTIALESPRRPDVARLVEELDALLESLYPAESNHLLAVEALAAPDVRFFVARRDGEALGCGALRLDAARWGEVKRLYVRPAARGMKLGRRLLDRIADEARREGLGVLRLEAGVRQPEALVLYRSAGFVERGPFGEYADDPASVFMEMPL